MSSKYSISQIYQLFSFLIAVSKRPSRVIHVVKGLIEDIAASFTTSSTLTEMSVILSAVNALIEDDVHPDRWTANQYMAITKELVLRARHRGHLSNGLDIDTFPITSQRLSEFNIAMVLAVVVAIVGEESHRSRNAIFLSNTELYVRRELEHIWRFLTDSERESFYRTVVHSYSTSVTEPVLSLFRRIDQEDLSRTNKVFQEKLRHAYESGVQTFSAHA